ncbi:MAG TPA: ABC transporter substrate-binding protein [Allosphingosinicella sp.]|nr:ABC transporter substrate-binding protein [Allosphingosinicella sp.]
MPAVRTLARFGLLTGLAALLALGGCGAPETGPIEVSAIGGPPRLGDPNRAPLDAPSAFLTEAVAQGLVRFNAEGEIEPALAQSWIISDDGLTFTFRLRRINWPDGGRVTAQQVAARLRLALVRASRNPLKPVLGAIVEIVAMTDEVVVINLRGPRPNFLQLLAHPELAIIQGNTGTGPYRISGTEDGTTLLQAVHGEDEEAPEASPDIRLRGEPALAAIARFGDDQRVLVIGGTAGDLPYARASDPPNNSLRFDPVSGLMGLSFNPRGGPLISAALRQALSMAVDRQAIATALGAPGLGPRTSLVPAGVQDLPTVTQPDWADQNQARRRDEARRLLAELALPAPLRLRVAIPDGPGYRLIFAHLRRDWRLIGVETVRVGPGEEADLIFIDEVAPANLGSWYLRHFTCDASAVCDPAADTALQAARLAPNAAERQAQFSLADRILARATPFIPLTAPVRWSLVPGRLDGFRPNPFARHPAVNLIAERP